MTTNLSGKTAKEEFSAGGPSVMTAASDNNSLGLRKKTSLTELRVRRERSFKVRGTEKITKSKILLSLYSQQKQHWEGRK